MIDILLLISFALDILLAYIILFKSSRHESDYAFAGTAMSIGLWTLGIMLFRMVGNLNVAWLMNSGYILASSFIASTFLHFSFLYSDIKLNNVQKALIYLPNLIILVLLMFPNTFISGIYVRHWGKESILGTLYPLFGIYFISFVTGSLLRIYKYGRTLLGEKKVQAIYILVATLMTSIVGIYFNLYLILIGNYQYIWVGPYNSLIFVAVITFAITKHHLMDISLFISRTFAEIITIVTLSSAYILVVFLHNKYISELIDPSYMFMTICCGVIVGMTYRRIRLFVQTTSDKVFLRGKYDYYKELAEISSKVTRSITKEGLLDVLRHVFRNVIEISNPRVLFVEKLDEPEIRQYTQIKDIVFTDQGLTIPCMIEDRLVALFVLGKKLSEEAYTEEDMRLLKNLSNQTAIALDHIRVYEEMLNAQKQLLLADKLTSLGNMAVNIAQKIKRPLDRIQSMLSDMQYKIKDRQYLAELKEVVPLQINEVDGYIEEMLSLARSMKGQG